MTLREFMQSPVYDCPPTANLSMAARKMETCNVAALSSLTARTRSWASSLSASWCLAHGHTAATTVAEMMSRNVVTVPDDADTRDVATAMYDRRVNRLPVADEQGQAVGIICLDDLYNYRLCASA